MAAGGPNPTRLYTRTGDHGETGLVGGHRIAKDSPRVRAFGTFDELAAQLGVAEAAVPAEARETRNLIVRLQHELFVAMSELATVPTAPPLEHRLEQRHVERLEAEIDRWTERLEPRQAFVLPRGRRGGAVLHLARTVARRAERELWSLHRLEPQRAELLQWTNRLSDLLFAVALATNRSENATEVVPDYSV